MKKPSTDERLESIEAGLKEIATAISYSGGSNMAAQCVVRGLAEVIRADPTLARHIVRVLDESSERVLGECINDQFRSGFTEFLGAIRSTLTESAPPGANVH